MADKKNVDEKSQVDKDREAELARQEAQRQAVHDATHDKDGQPKPIVAP